MARGDTKQGVSFRFHPWTVERLKQRAIDVGAPQAALAERYIEEGMRIDEHPGIYFRDAGSGRRPAGSDRTSTSRRSSRRFARTTTRSRRRPSTSTSPRRRSRRPFAITPPTRTRLTSGSSRAGRSRRASASSGSASRKSLSEASARRDDFVAHRCRATEQRPRRRRRQTRQAPTRVALRPTRPNGGGRRAARGRHEQRPRLQAGARANAGPRRGPLRRHLHPRRHPAAQQGRVSTMGHSARRVPLAHGPHWTPS